MTEGSASRAWPLFDATLFGVAFVLYALALPLGLARVETASQVAASIGLDTSAERATLALLAVHLVQLLPLGDQALRANLATALLGAATVALFGRMCLEIMVRLRPVANARQDSRSFLHEPIAGAGAALAVALSLSTFDAATSGGTAAATLLVLVAGLRAALALLGDLRAERAGWLLAGLAGLAAGVDPIAGPLLWPLVVGLAIWALRTGARWPLLAPLAFVAGLGGAVLAAVACSSTPVVLGDFLDRVGRLSAHGGRVLWLTVVELGDEVGVISALLAVIGLVTIATRTLLLAAWLVLTLLSAVVFALPVSPGGGPAGPAAAALPLAVAMTAVLASVGLIHLSGKLGRARLAAALALAVMLVVTPALDGGWVRSARGPTWSMHLLDRALDRVELRAVVDPGTREMDGLFRLARVLGMRPDMVVGGRVR